MPASLPVGMTMFTYKTYLDARWPHAARLHDWLYTPYGGLIDVTQLEADNAIREEIEVDSTPDAVIVYSAVRWYGHLFFGQSQTGFAGMPAASSGYNMSPAPSLTSGGSRVATKCVIVFQQLSSAEISAPNIGYAPVERIGGWTESVLGPDDMGVLMSMLKGPRDDFYPGLLPARADMLSNSGKILGVRFYQGGAGKGKFVPMRYDGSGGEGDVPSMSLLCAASSAFSGKVRRWTVRGVPDLQIVRGEFRPSNAYSNKVQEYFRSLNGFSFKYINPGAGLKVFSVSAAGLVTLEGASPYAAGNIVQLSGVKITNAFKTGKFVVGSVGPFGTQFTVQGWTFGEGKGGKVGQPTSGTVPIGLNGDTISVTRATNHKVGRPFGGYRGRRSKRR